MKAMILAAGLGTRLKPWTDHHPKALALVNGKSLLQRNIQYLQQFGIRQVVVNVHHFANQIIKAIEENNGWGSTIQISDETNEVLETGGGLMKASSFLQNEENFVLMNVDILTDLNLEAMMRFHQTHSPLSTLATSHRETSRYLLFNQNNNLCGWRNIKTMEEKHGKKSITGGEVQVAFNGVHIINQKIFSVVRKTGKFSMIDLYLTLMDEHDIKAYNITGSAFTDVGKPESVSVAEKLFK